jgi:hypothetical protein
LFVSEGEPAAVLVEGPVDDEDAAYAGERLRGGPVVVGVGDLQVFEEGGRGAQGGVLHVGAALAGDGGDGGDEVGAA